MSEFLGTEQDQAQPQQEPEQPQEQADQPFLVLGERVFKSPEEVTTKMESADAFIEQLKQENATMREQLSSSTKVDQVLEALKNQEPQQEAPQVPQEEHTPSMEEPSVEEMVQQALLKSKAEEQATNNMLKAKQALTEKYGDKLGEVYTSKLNELGMTDEFATNLAKTSPDAFTKLFGGEVSKGSSPSIASSPGVNTQAMSQKPAEPVKVHQIKDKAARLQEIQKRIQDASAKYYNGQL